MPVSEATYEQVALEDLEGQWELVCGRLRSKPAMTIEHNDVQHALYRTLTLQLDHRAYSVRVNAARLRISTGTYYIPDLCVIPLAVLERKRQELPRRLEVYEEALPLVVEVWSPSTGDYDIEEKLREYQRRGDLEIWRIHPYERTLTAWRRQADGAYIEVLYHTGMIQPVALSTVVIELERLFR